MPNADPPHHATFRAGRGRAGGPAPRVLIVDDEPDVCQVLETALVALGGYEVRVANGAKTALLEIEKQDPPFDGVFLDIQMPGVSGIELCSVIRTTPGYQNVPIIMLTAMTGQSYLRKAFSVGASDYITKPFDFDELKFRFSQERRKRHQRDVQNPTIARDPSAREEVFSLDQAFAIRGVDRCIRKEAFENLVVNTSARHDDVLNVRAVKIAKVHELFSALPGDGFRVTVTEIARALSTQTAETHDVISYFGNGVFLVLGFGRSDLSAAGLSALVEKSPALARTGPHRGMHLIVGREVALSGLPDAEVMSGLSTAIDAAEHTETRAFGWRSYREWLSFKKSVGREQKRLDQAAYEHMLNDFLFERERDSR